MCPSDHDVSFSEMRKVFFDITSVVRVVEAQEIFEIALI